MLATKPERQHKSVKLDQPELSLLELTFMLFVIVSDSAANVLQGDRHSMAYFANAGASTRLQGPQKKYPPITFPEILAEKQRQTEDADFDKMNDEQKTEFMTTKALGPEMEYLVEDHKDASGDAIITPKDPKGALLDAMQNLAVGS